jgi:cyclophilin family peptidyl-prolyl cis-trans isomerase
MKQILSWAAGFLALASSVHGGTLAQFRTVFGTIEVELYDQEKPATVRNFIRLVQGGAYQNTFIHRLVPGFVAQGGGYFTLSTGSTNLFAPPWNNVGSVPNFGPITNEYNTGPLLSNTNGTIAMAKLGGNPNSATCEWFFNLTNNAANLDNQNGGFTVFGRVIRDANNVLPFLNARSYGNGLISMGWWYPADGVATNLFTALPVTFAGVYPPRHMDLVYVDITLLQVEIASSNGVQQIAWNSIASQTNVVEYTTQLPPAWQTLVSTNGDGTRFTVTDASADPNRFYRVRVVY